MQKTYPTCKKLILVVFFQAAQFLQQVYLEDFPIDDGKGFAKNAEVSSLSFDGVVTPPKSKSNMEPEHLEKEKHLQTSTNHQFLCLIITFGGCTHFPSCPC